MYKLIAYLHVLGALMTWHAIAPSLKQNGHHRSVAIGIAVTWPASIPVCLGMGAIDITWDSYRGNCVRAPAYGASE